MAYKYLITEKTGGKKRLVEASSPAVAIAHVAKDGYTVERVSDAVAGMIGLTIEKVTPEKETPTPAPTPDAGKAGSTGGDS